MARAPARDLALAGLFAALTAVGAKLMLPLGPVPFTLQPLVVLLCGVILRPRLALLSQLTYLGVGLLGLPVFAYGGGLGYVLNPTFGFLVGFALGAWAISAVVNGRGEPGWGRMVGGLTLGMAIVYACGVGGLYLNLAVFQGKPGAFRTVVLGFGWFLVFDLVKVVLAALLARPLRSAVRGQDWPAPPLTRLGP
ncbi:MAG: biotin transporter BioY [Deferrisomatales bacterium]|nr:biotin transporter BioY [Deferrisomatales bacterium]